MVLIEIIEVFLKLSFPLAHSIICQWVLGPIKGIYAQKHTNIHTEKCQLRMILLSFVALMLKERNNTCAFLQQGF